MNLNTIKTYWQDTPEYHKHIHELFCSLVDSDPQLLAHRNWITDHVYGMGEKSFQWFWNLLVQEMPNKFNFLEIGVHKGQILSLIRILSNRYDKHAYIFGITPMNGSGTGWTEDDYQGDIAKLHHQFDVIHPFLHKGYSQDLGIVKTVGELQYDCLYVDGSHTYDDAKFDLYTYSKFVKPGGYLVVDDAACRMSMPFGYFQGIEEVCRALQSWELNDLDEEWEFQFNVVHLMVYKKIK